MADPERNVEHREHHDYISRRQRVGERIASFRKMVRRNGVEIVALVAAGAIPYLLGQTVLNLDGEAPRPPEPAPAVTSFESTSPESAAVEGRIVTPLRSVHEDLQDQPGGPRLSRDTLAGKDGISDRFQFQTATGYVEFVVTYPTDANDEISSTPYAYDLSFVTDGSLDSRVLALKNVNTGEWSAYGVDEMGRFDAGLGTQDQDRASATTLSILGQIPRT